MLRFQGFSGLRRRQSHAAVAALRLPVRPIRTAGQRGDSPKAAALIDRLVGLGHVVADAVHDFGTLQGKPGTNFGR